MDLRGQARRLPLSGGTKQSGRITLWSRRGNGFTHRFPKIAQACEKLPHDTLIEGEVVALDEAGRVSFNALQHSSGRIHSQLYVFDVLVHRGRSVVRLPLDSRRDLLAHAMCKVGYPVIQIHGLRRKTHGSRPSGQGIRTGGRNCQAQRITVRTRSARRRLAEIQNQTLSRVRDRRLHSRESF